MPKPCQVCGSDKHTKTFCFYAKKKKPNQLGRRGNEYIEWRDNIAIPHLDSTYGHKCASCGVGGKLDVQHIKKRGSHPELRMELSNVEYLCRSCHIKAT